MTRRFRHWVALCALAEALGISVAVLWYAAVDGAFPDPQGTLTRVVTWLGLSAAAIPEGIALGGLQSIGVRWFLPGISRLRWVAATMCVGWLGWAVGTWFPVFMPFDGDTNTAAVEPDILQVLAFTTSFGVCAGALIGGAQSLVMPRKIGNSDRTPWWRSIRWIWVLAHSVGWAVGLPCIYIAASFGADMESVAARIACWVTGALLAGASVGLATAAGLAIHARQQQRGVA